ncbi:DUF4145 domain-containing protein [Acinetobacter lanii]|uniref:DUF4145 domain-containing protein n=1 Tax=Acinetobacter lanii TaxID=2715163 RepID=A0A6G8S0X1_9GAMM|nr:DUF4145 domain-containing protein [Acinetobacter lanii]QIO07678.1 DUF4145 domain-containing protein [Acinetobacter lanii]
MSNFTWECPYCNHKCYITQNNISNASNTFHLSNKFERQLCLNTYVIVCPNTSCAEVVISASLHRDISLFMGDSAIFNSSTDSLLEKWQLRPFSQAKIFPSYIPFPILNDYEEACKIRDLSPKASATLARRCLQGILRDFWEVKPDNLNKEIDQIEEKVDPLIFDAINAVRQLGNIGAHMEKNINLIIDVAPDEAQKLIELIELLLEEWYIARHRRQERLQSIKAINETKQEERKATN